MQETYRLIEALQSAGWSSDDIINLIKYIESGDKKFLRSPEKANREERKSD